MLYLENSCFLRRPQKLMKSSPSIWRSLHSVKLTVKILSIFVAFSENVNFKNRRMKIRIVKSNYWGRKISQQGISLNSPQHINNTILLSKNIVNVTKALTKYNWSKIKRRCPSKMQSFSQKRTAFLEGISFHFWPFVFL